MLKKVAAVLFLAAGCCFADTGTVPVSIVKSTGIPVSNFPSNQQVNFGGVGQPVTSTSTFVINVPTITFNGSSQPVNTTNISTMTFNGIGQPVTSTNTLVQGTQANGATTIPSPVLGGVVASSNPLAGVSDTQLTRTLGGLDGTTFVQLGASRSQFVESGIITLNNSTTETLFVSSAGASSYNDLAGIFEINTSTTGVEVDLCSKGGPSGQTGSIPVYLPPTDTRGAIIPFFWPQLTANANWTVKALTAVSSVKIAGLFLKRKV